MEEYKEGLRRGYEAFGQGDVEGAIELFSRDIRWQGPDAHGLPDSGTFHGKAEVSWMLKELRRTFGEDLRVTPDEFIVDGRTIVVIGHLEAKPGGVALRVPWVHIWRFEDRTVAHVQALTDTALVRDALTH